MAPCIRTSSNQFCKSSCDPSFISCVAGEDCLCDDDCGFICVKRGDFIKSWSLRSKYNCCPLGPRYLTVPYLSCCCYCCLVLTLSYPSNEFCLANNLVRHIIAQFIESTQLLYGSVCTETFFCDRSYLPSFLANIPTFKRIQATQAINKHHSQELDF